MNGADLARRIDRRITFSLLAAHGLGALDVFIALMWILPEPDRGHAANDMANIIAMAAYMPVAGVAGYVLGTRSGRKARQWLIEGRAPTEEERMLVLRTPLTCTRIDGLGWVGALVVFTILNGVTGSWSLAFHVAVTILLGGLTVIAVSYLLVERLAQPITAIVLQEGPPLKPVGPGVHGRLVLAWLCATGVPLLGLVMVAWHALTEGATAHELVRSIFFLGGVALSVGLAATIAVAQSVSRPVTSVRHALARVQAGDLGTEVRIDDGSEIGLLQSGFNRMAAGLRERERLRDLFGRHVGEDVARHALQADPELGGEQREVAVLFVDMVGSTTLAASQPPDQVVALLNRFFATVVETVDAHGGWVNKFEGDAAMCVFGAPVEHEDPAACALTAARDLSQRLQRELPQIDIGIGVSAGTAVAGWVGAERRLEYTVIGDPVNEAARLCDLAKREGQRVLACEAIVSRAHDGERRFWRLGEHITLRGRLAPTRLAIPA